MQLGLYDLFMLLLKLLHDKRLNQLGNLIPAVTHAKYSNYQNKNQHVAPKLRNYWCFGIVPITFEGGLQNVNVYVQLGQANLYRSYPSGNKLLEYFLRLMLMFRGLGSAMSLTIDLETIEALSEISSFLVASPFYNLKYVKLPRGYKERSLTTTIRNYLVALQEPLLSQHCLRDVSSLVQGFRGKMMGAHTAGEGNHQASSSKGCSHIGIWQGHEVNPEFVGLLDTVMKIYPETFEYFTTKSKKLCTMELNTLCTSVNAFTQISLVEVDTEMITEYRALFADLQRSFNIKWLVNCLDYIDDAKRKLQDLQTLHKKKMAKIQNAS